MGALTTTRGLQWRKALVRDGLAGIAGLHAGTYTILASGYALADPRRKTLQSRVLTLDEGVGEAELELRF